LNSASTLPHSLCLPAPKEQKMRELILTSRSPVAWSDTSLKQRVEKKKKKGTGAPSLPLNDVNPNFIHVESDGGP